jgi:predicted transcriptional regulator
VDWRTPQANEAGAKVETLYTKDGQPAKPGQRAYRKTPDGRMVLQSQTINQQVEMVQNWQTATVSTGAHRQKDGSMIDKLDQQVKNWATPRAEMDSGAHNGVPDTLHSQMKVQAVGRLNARWVETLMNLPVGWTMPSCASPVTIERMNSDFSETESFQPPQSGPSEC